MPSSEPEDQLRPPPQTTTGEPSGPQEVSKETKDATDTRSDAGDGATTSPPADEKAADAEPAWPPVETRPEKAAQEPAPATGQDAVLTKPEAAAAPKTEEAAPKTEEAAAPKSEEAAPKTEEAAAEPKQEMGLSESTLHWLVDGEQPVEALSNDPSTAPHYDPSASVAGRKRTIAVIGGAAILAVIIAGVLHAQAAGHRAAVEATAAEPAAVLTQRAETALAAGRSGEAMDLAHLAIVADPRFADAYAVEGKVQRDSGRLAEARDAYRKYLELAPIGTHAEEARQALAALPP